VYSMFSFLAKVFLKFALLFVFVVKHWFVMHGDFLQKCNFL